jgi:hypothetical protein
MAHGQDFCFKKSVAGIIFCEKTAPQARMFLNEF